MREDLETLESFSRGTVKALRALIARQDQPGGGSSLDGGESSISMGPDSSAEQTDGGPLMKVLRTLLKKKSVKRSHRQRRDASEEDILHILCA